MDKILLRARAWSIPQGLPFFILFLFGVTTRLLLSWNSVGTNDVIAWESFAQAALQHGLQESYRSFAVLNHPPLSLLINTTLLELSQLTSLPFPFMLRLLPILADLGTCLLLQNIYARHSNAATGWKVAAAYSLSLLAILISGYHGNTDSIYAFFCLLAVYYIQEKYAFFKAGLALALALNIKLIPLILIPALFALCRNLQDRRNFLSALATGAAPFLILLVKDLHALNNLIFYYPHIDLWGVDFLLHRAGFNHSSMLAYVFIGRYLILLASLSCWWLAVNHYCRNGYHLAALVMAAFLILAPGFGVQYLIAVLPLIFATSFIWGSVYGLLAGGFTLLLYYEFWEGAFPPYSRFEEQFSLQSAGAGFLCWLALIAFSAYILFKNKRFINKDPSSSDSSECNPSRPSQAM